MLRFRPMDDDRLQDLLARAERDLQALRASLAERDYEGMYRRAQAVSYAGRNLRSELSPMCGAPVRQPSRPQASRR